MTDPELIETSGVLDLSGADTSTFDAIPAAKYKAAVWEVEWTKTSNPDGTKKLPDGTPMLKVQWRLDNDEHADTEYTNGEGETTKIGKNRTMFSQFPIPPAGYDEDKASKMKGSLVNFLVGIGYAKEKVTKGNFKIEPEDMKAREACILVNRYWYPKDVPVNDPMGSWQNGVQGVKPVSAYTSSGAASSTLL